MTGVVDVPTLQGADACRWHGLTINRPPEGQGRQDRNLVGSIEAVHISCRIGFGVAEPLGVGQHVVVGRALVRHAREDVVGGAVDDSADPVDAVAPEGLLQRFDDRNATTHGGFDQHVHPSRLGGSGNLTAVTGDHGLVGGDDGLARCDRLQDQAAGRFDAADHFHDDIDAGIGHHRRGIGGQHGRRQVHGSWSLQITHRHANEIEIADQGMAVLRVQQD